MRDLVRLAALMGRDLAGDRMQDTARVEVLGEPVTDDDGNVTAGRTEVYAGPCEVQSSEPVPRVVESAGATETVQRSVVKFPVGSFRPAEGQVVTITAAELDPHLVGREFQVTGLLHKSFATAYRLVVEEV